MQQQLEILWQIQCVELEKVKLNHQQRKINTEEIRTLWQEIKGISLLVSEVEASLSQSQQMLQKLEEEIHHNNSELKEKEDHLYGEWLLPPKELEKIQIKIADLKATIETKEDAALVILAKIENNSLVFAEKQNLLKNKKIQHADKQQEYLVRQDEVKLELNRLDCEYKQLSQLANQVVFNEYKKLKTKYIAPIARLQNGVCGGCHVGLPETGCVVQKGKLTYCDNCGRLLIIS